MVPSKARKSKQPLGRLTMLAPMDLLKLVNDFAHATGKQKMEITAEALREYFQKPERLAIIEADARKTLEGVAKLKGRA